MIPRTWTATTAKRMGFAENDLDDLHQEVLIETWRRGLDAPESHQRRSAKLRLLNLRRGHPQTGVPRRNGQRGHGKALEIALDFTDTDNQTLTGEMAVMQDSDTKVDVQRALKALPQMHRRIAFMRVWEERSWEEIAEAFLTSTWTINKLWTEEIVPALQASLR